ncbi:MAG: type III pantothenate kinase [Eggerthellaceae bacterium]|nr:type III pantothenate kinase [Eggerthellaceae bacterium]
MLLAVDIGNTQTVVGVYQGSDLACMWRLATNPTTTADEVRVMLLPLFESAGLSPSQVGRAALASVVPQLTDAWRRAIRDASGAEALVCSAASAGGLFEADYPHPDEIGADRVADAVAAKARYGAPVVVVDFGTATNIEVIDAQGRFVGGIIAPGLQTSAQTLFSRGAQLPAISLTAPEHPIGVSTVTAMQSGIVLGEVDRVDGLVRRIFAQLGYEGTVVATGGLAPLIAPHSQVIDSVDGELTLEGLRLIAEAAGL